MSALRCTAKLLKAMKARPVANPAPAMNRLGDWTANLIRVSRIQLVLAVNDATRLGIVVDAAPYAGVPDRIAERIFRALIAIGVPPDSAAGEAEAVRTGEIAATQSKSVLGTLNQFAFDVESDLYHDKARSAWELTLRLMDRPIIKPKDIGFPIDRVRECFGLPKRQPRLHDAHSQLPTEDIAPGRVIH